ncbi:MAG: hypothetical protein K0R15_2201 [Clostridiales bacterium]|jgi:murein DD-endopeptidase MepM/ murein hydrolase activator NlpD|nr:hypothetical protein [Clostridiales bacterium]
MVRGENMMRRLKNFKQKEFYLVLLLGFVSVFTLITIIYSNRVGKDANKNPVVDLNEPDENVDVVDNSNNDTDGIQDSQKPIVEYPTSDFTVVNGALIGPDGKPVAKIPANGTTNNNGDEVVDSNDDTQSVINVIAGGKKDKTDDLHFDEGEGMKWPLIGEILLPYSMDKGIYFATLDQYKCNPAICIKAEVGTSVNAAAKGKVEKIETNEETGITVTLDHGNGYKTVYGQLKDVALKEGDIVEQNSQIGAVENPTKYYVKNGSNLYFKILKDEKPIDPSTIVK